MDGERERIKNDIKTTFLIANTFHAVVAGLYPLSVCVALLVTEGFILLVKFCFGFGALMAAFAALGYYAAFVESKKMLHTYSAMMALASVLDVAGVVASMLPFDDFTFDQSVVILCIVHIGVTLAVVSLAAALASRVRHDVVTEQGHRVTSWLKLGCGSLFVFIIICLIYYF